MRNQSPVAFATAGEREQGLLCPTCAGTVQRDAAIAVCQLCGTVHHGACWERTPACGSYACAPARRTCPPDRQALLTLTRGDLDRASPLPARRPSGPAVFPPREQAAPSSNRLAWAAFVTGLAGIPLFGVLTGLVAILLGSLAVGSKRLRNRLGTALAIAGIFLGLGDVVGWLVFLTVALSGPAPLPQFTEFEIDAEALADLKPELARAMRSNVLIQSSRGLGGTVSGSGVILRIRDGEALVVTNRHVVDPDFGDAEPPAGHLERLANVPVAILGQAASPGTVVWLAPHGIDLALVSVACRSDQARAALWQRGRPLQIGQSVFAIGNPLGLGWTHTQGVVSQFRQQEYGGFIARVIQTQTALNPGNSGGGLFDQAGFLVGINSWVKDKRVSEGLGFALSFTTLLDLNPRGFDLPDGRHQEEEP